MIFVVFTDSFMEAIFIGAACIVLSFYQLTPALEQQPIFSGYFLATKLQAFQHPPPTGSGALRAQG